MRHSLFLGWTAAIRPGRQRSDGGSAEDRALADLPGDLCRRPKRAGESEPEGGWATRFHKRRFRCGFRVAKRQGDLILWGNEGAAVLDVDEAAAGGGDAKSAILGAISVIAGHAGEFAAAYL